MATTFTNFATLTLGDESVVSNTVTGQIETTVSVSKNALADTYEADGQIVYAVSIVNAGTTALTDVTLSDDLGAYEWNGTSLQPLDYVEGSLLYYADGVLQPEPTVSTDSGLVISGLTVPASGSALIIYAAAPNAYAPLETDASITNTVTVGSSGCETTAEETVTASSSPQLSILKAISPASVVSGDEITYTFTLQNAGNTAVLDTDNAVVADTFSPALSNICVTLNGTALTEGSDYTYDEGTGVFTTIAGAISIPAASFTQDETTGEWSATPGQSILVVTGTITSC